MATMLKTDDAEPEGPGPDRLPLFSRASDNATSPIAIASLLIGGPYDAQVPADSPSRQLVFVCHPASAAEETSLRDEDPVATGRRAYRRAATGDDVETLLSFYKRARGQHRQRNFRRRHSRRAGARAGEPRFSVPHRDRSRGRRCRARVYRISDVELASRLSFFLWSSIPDDTLLDLGHPREIA